MISVFVKSAHASYERMHVKVYTKSENFLLKEKCRREKERDRIDIRSALQIYMEAVTSSL